MLAAGKNCNTFSRLNDHISINNNIQVQVEHEKAENIINLAAILFIAFTSTKTYISAWQTVDLDLALKNDLDKPVCYALLKNAFDNKMGLVTGISAQTITPSKHPLLLY